MQDIKSMYLDELTKELSPLGLPAYKCRQIFVWLHAKGVNSFEHMTDISAQMRAKLAEKYYISVANIEKMGYF